MDKNVRPLKKYYYKVSAIRSHEEVLEEGSFSPACSISVSGILTPKIRMKKGYQQKNSYIMIVLKKHQGKYIDIYTSFNGKKYSKLKGVSHQIDRYKGRFKIRYTVAKKVIYIKVRT